MKIKIYWSATAQLAMATLVVISILLPHFTYYYINRDHVTKQVLVQLVTTPENETLSSVSKMGLGISLGITEKDLVPTADDILLGKLRAPVFLEKPISLIGYPGDLFVGATTFQLVIASLQIEDVLLDAYEKSGNRAYLERARSRVFQFIDYESRQYNDQAFLWNDHAIASRIAVLARLWLYTRTDTEVADRDKMSILDLVQRSGRLLSKPSHFTVHTNHGVMQNIGLLQIAAAFPSLVESKSWRTLAMSRLERQLEFYISDEGMVLEHSATYHRLGDKLLNYAKALAELNGLAVSERMKTAAAQARSVLDILVRPDGSLPRFGNTDEPPDADYASPQNRDLSPLSLVMPLSGYAVWWQKSVANRSAVQSVVTWAKHDHHGHKHADETAVHLWSEGTDWITATGYWPYDKPGFSEANGWRGANAPHLAGESADSARSAKLISYGSSNDVRFVDVLRDGPGSFKTRRQALLLGDGRFVVLDFNTGATIPVETVWTFDPSLTLHAMEDGSYASSRNHLGTHMSILTYGYPKAKIEMALGKSHPFAGWVVLNRTTVPAPALVVTQPGDESYRVTSFNLNNASDSSNNVKTVSINEGPTPESWTLNFGTKGPILKLDSDRLIVETSPESPPIEIGLTHAPDISSRQHSLRKSMQSAISEYPKWRNLYFYRVRAAYSVGGLFLFSMVAWAFILKYKKSLAGLPWLATMGAAWLSIGLWSHFVYFKA